MQLLTGSDVVGGTPKLLQGMKFITGKVVLGIELDAKTLEDIRKLGRVRLRVCLEEILSRHCVRRKDVVEPLLALRRCLYAIWFQFQFSRRFGGRYRLFGPAAIPYLLMDVMAWKLVTSLLLSRGRDSNASLPSPCPPEQDSSLPSMRARRR